MQHQYIKKFDLPISPLGFGVMRLPMNTDGTFPQEVHHLLLTAHECGINYFDTAYPYLGGHSEELIRDTLVAKRPRDSFYIADKMPVWECSSTDDMERIFNIQLERLGVDYIDFYLLHGLHRERWLGIQSKGVLGFLEQKHKEGKIHKIGFSMHDTPETLKLILDAYDWDFAQLQINYYDWGIQRAGESYTILEQRDIPCLVMEPVGGGRLAKLPKDAEKILKDIHPDASIASWAIRFAASLPNVAVTLSGMSDITQLDDNLSHFEMMKPFSETEREALDEVVGLLNSRNTIPCGGCGYCVDECPKNIDIPQIFSRFNDFRLFDNMARFDIDYFAFIPERKRANACIACGKCSKKCPQNIDIPNQLKTIHSFAVGLSVGVDLEKLKKHLSDNNDTVLVCFGAGAVGKTTHSVLCENGFQIDYFCDNAERLWGTAVDGILVISPTELQKIAKEANLCVLVTSGYRDEIIMQLKLLNISQVI